MVVFTCQHCGDSIQKPKVEKHYFQTKCRSKNPFLTCVDCLKDFAGQDYTKHTECLTEEQRYAPKGTVFKKGKGQSKQLQYTEMIQNILNSKDLGLNNTQRKLLEVCSNHSNVPRKWQKFQNFMKNSARSLKYPVTDLKSVFDLLEDSFKNVSGKTNTSEIDIELSENKPLNDSSGETLSKKLKKCKNCTNKKENEDFNELDARDRVNELENKNEVEIKKNIKKRKHDAALTESNVKRTKTISDTEEEHVAFDWANVIVRVLESRPSQKLSLSRLAKKVVHEYQTVRPNDHRTHEQLLAKFNKKIKKTPGVVVLKDKASLTDQ